MSKEKFIKMTYNNYLSMSTNPTKEYLMLSELIDNSISSFEVKNGEDYNDWPKSEVVEIDIKIFTNSSDKRRIDTYHGKQVKNGSYISVSDNAYGMSEDILYKAIEIDNKKIVSGSNKNVHGRGMKQAAFFFGMGLNIKTNNTENSFEMNVDLTQVPDLSNPFERIVSPSNKPTRGTEIKIFNIFYSRTMERSTLSETIEALKTRFWKYIASSRLIIRINSDISGGTDEVIDSRSNVPLYLNIDTIDNFFSATNKRKALLGIENIIKNTPLSPHKNSKNGELIDSKKALIKNTILDTYKSTGNLHWKYNSVSFGFIDQKINIDISFWRNGSSTNYGPYRGIYIHEGGRAIKHGPNSGAYLEWFKNSDHSTGSTDNRFYGEFDITNIPSITAINDKSNVDIPKDIKDELNDFIYWNWFLFDKIENFIRKNDAAASVNFNKRPIKTKLKERYTSMEAKENPNLAFAEEVEVHDDKSLVGKFDISGELWEISILPDNSNLESSTIIEDFNVKVPEKTITTFYNENADIWNKANNGNATEFYAHVLFPILVQLSILYINLEVRKLASFKDSLNNKRTIKEKDVKID